jgi:hypothetical protein
MRGLPFFAGSPGFDVRRTDHEFEDSPSGCGRKVCYGATRKSIAVTEGGYRTSVAGAFRLDIPRKPDGSEAADEQA